MTVELKFNLPEEKSEAEAALGGADALNVLHELDNKMRAMLKYEEHGEEVNKVVQGLRDLLWSECEDRNVKME